MKKINENIKKLRTKRKISQEKMAELLEKTRSAYSKQESSGDFSSSEILKIVDFFKVNVNEIFDNESAYMAVFNDSEKGKKRFEDLTPFTATNSEQELILSLRKLPKNRLRELLDSIKEEVEKQ